MAASSPSQSVDHVLAGAELVRDPNRESCNQEQGVNGGQGGENAFHVEL